MRLIIVSLAFMGGMPAAKSGKTSSLTVEGMFSIGSPGKGYEWEYVTTKASDGMKARFYYCGHPNASAAMVLCVEERTADTQAKRRTTVKAHWNGFVRLEDEGYTEIAGKKPSLDGAIPDRVDYSLTGKGPGGAPLFFRAATVFGKYVYCFQAMASTATDAESLLAVVKSLREAK